MKYCSRLLNEINFEPSALQSCCNIRALKVPAFPYNGGSIDLGAYANHIGSVLQEIQAGGDTCKGCPELVDLQPESMRMRAKFSAVSINMHRFFCNCRCSYCGLWRHKEKGYGYDVFPGLRSLHDQGALVQDALISWGGGEPSILPGFDNTAAWLLDHGYLQHIHTNALRWSEPVQGLLAAGRGVVNVSLDSGSSEIYSAVKGVDGFGKVLNTVRRYAEAGGPLITLKYIVFEANNSIGEIESFLQLARRLGTSVQYSLNFEEINQNRVSGKTFLAAAWLQKRAGQLKLPCEPFYIDPVWSKKIEEAGKELDC